jgi:hypothetical protein
MSDSDIPDEGDDMETATLETNTGGRVRYIKETKVRILELDGTISKVPYLTDQERSDRKGFIALKESDGTRVIKIHHRRVLPLSVEGKAVVVESGDKFWALCPECGQPIPVGTGDIEISCQPCSKSYPLHWLGVKPMAEATTTEKAPKAEKAKAPKAEKAPKAPKAEKAPREPKVVKEPVKIDVHALTKFKHCELWTKKQVKFDHPNIDVQAHVLLWTGESPRKLCFNTYNATLGKKTTELPVEQFIANKPLTGAGVKKDVPWFPVPDLDKARSKLQKDGYEQQK